jgi:UDP-N-acetylmuramate: L-alanyl-gamma-D-glutamyl-meso-diaminopimelate ligase
LAREHGLSESQIAEAFRTFRGVKRRQEIAGEVRGVLVIDDFAHHPTAVRETLQAFRARYPGRRLVAVFEPRSATSRRKVFQKDFASALRIADSCFIAQPYDQSRIDPANQFSTDQLVEDIRRLGGGAWVMKDVDSGVLEVASASKSGDVVAILSNGGFGGFIPKLLKALIENNG